MGSKHVSIEEYDRRFGGQGSEVSGSPGGTDGAPTDLSKPFKAAGFSDAQARIGVLMLESGEFAGFADAALSLAQATETAVKVTVGQIAEASRSAAVDGQSAAPGSSRPDSQYVSEAEYDQRFGRRR